MLLALAAAQAILVIAVPTLPAIAIGLWWNANTISHQFIHRPFFHRQSANRLFAAYLSVLLGFPHALWRERHLAHHAGGRCHARAAHDLLLQSMLVLLTWAVIGAWSPRFFLTVYLPGCGAGLLLCQLHGYYEHATGTTSYYGGVYNLLLFNDGYHVEHHARPWALWWELPQHRDDSAPISRWPAPLRWLDSCSLVGLERLVLRSRTLQRFVLRTHAAALGELIAALPPIHRVAIVGGGLFPRTAIVLRQWLPTATITVIDSRLSHLEQARPWLDALGIHPVHAHYPRADIECADLVVFPLAFEGRRDDVYSHPPASAIIVHDWIWRKRGTSRVVSPWLLKRANLVQR